MFSSSGTNPRRFTERRDRISSVDIMSPCLMRPGLTRFRIRSGVGKVAASTRPITRSASLIEETSGVATTTALSAGRERYGNLARFRRGSRLICIRNQVLVFHKVPASAQRLQHFYREFVPRGLGTSF